MTSKLETTFETAVAGVIDVGPSEALLDLETLAASLWAEGGTVPYPIASALTIGAAEIVIRDPSAPRDVRLAGMRVTPSGSVRLARQNESSTIEHAEDPLADLGVVLWELLVGRRFGLDDVLSNGDLRPLAATCMRERLGVALGSLERRVLAEVEPIVVRSLSRASTTRFGSLDSFVRALDAAIRPASPLRIAEWLRVVAGPRTRLPLVTPSPPATRPLNARPARSESMRLTDASAPNATNALSLLDGIGEATRFVPTREVVHASRAVVVDAPWWNLPAKAL